MKIRPRPILTHKTLRDLWVDRWRALSIAVTLAAGIGIGLAIVGATSGGAAALVMKLLGSL